MPDNQSPGLFDYPSSLAFGIIVGYALALLLAVIVAALRRKTCCPVVHVDRVSRAEYRRIVVDAQLNAAPRAPDEPAELQPLTSSPEDAVLVETEVQVQVEPEQQQRSANNPVVSGDDEAEVDEESKSLRRLTEQLDAILDEFSSDDLALGLKASPAGAEGADEERKLSDLAQAIVTAAIQQAINELRADEQLENSN